MSGRPRRVRACKSKKGRLRASVRQDLNEERSDAVVAEAIAAKERGAPFESLFARVTGLLGMGRVRANLPTGHTSTEIKIQIPNVFGKKGVTPINSQTIVAIFVGKDFNPLAFDATVHFKLTSILNDKQSGHLVEAGVIPDWMTAVTAEGTETAGAPEAFVFDYSDKKDEEDEDDDEEDEEEKDEKKKAVVERAAAATVAATVATVEGKETSVSDEESLSLMGPSSEKGKEKTKGKGKDKPGHRQNVVVYEDVDTGFSFE